MKNFSAIISIIIFCSCFAQKQEPVYQVTSTKKNVVLDTIYLDTLVMDNKTEKFISQNWIIKSTTDEVLFAQTIYNEINDTIEIRAQAAAGWVAPSWNNRPINQNGYSKISYLMLTKFKKRLISTTVSIMYMKANSQDKNFKHMTIILIGRIDK
jgi:hypothetical protein